MNFILRSLWKCQILVIFEANARHFGSIRASGGVYGSRGLNQASRLLQVGLLEPIRTQLGSKLAPTWLKLLPLGSSWANVGPICESPATPGPTQALPDPLPLGLPNPHKTQNGFQKSPPSLQLGA